MNATNHVSVAQKPKLLDRVRHAARLRHLARRTEKACVYWLAVCVPRGQAVDRSPQPRATAPPPGSLLDSTCGARVDARSRHPQTCRTAHVSAFLCHPAARTRNRHPQRAGAARPQGRYSALQGQCAEGDQGEPRNHGKKPPKPRISHPSLNKTTQIYTHVLNQNAWAIRSPADDV